MYALTLNDLVESTWAMQLLKMNIKKNKKVKRIIKSTKNIYIPDADTTKEP